MASHFEAQAAAVEISSAGAQALSADADAEENLEAVAEDNFFAQDAQREAAAIKWFDSLDERKRFAWRSMSGTKRLVVSSAGVTLVAIFLLVVLGHFLSSSHASVSHQHAGAPVEAIPTLPSQGLMPSLPSGPEKVGSTLTAGAPAPALVPAQPTEADESSAVALCQESLAAKPLRTISIACDAALDVDAELVKPILGWAKAEFAQGRNGIAVAWAHRIVKADPTAADAYLIIGVAEQDQSRKGAARQAYKRYLELAPQGAYAGDVRSVLRSM
jgi:tetratricopeptide (TPR) repeat protein